MGACLLMTLLQVQYLQNILRDFNQKLYLPVQTSTGKDSFDHKSFLGTLILVLLFNLILSAFSHFYDITGLYYKNRK